MSGDQMILRGFPGSRILIGLCSHVDAGAGHVDEKIRRRIWVIVLIPLGGGHVDEKKRRRIWVVVVVVNGDGRVQTVGGAVGHRVDALSGGGDQ